MKRFEMWTRYVVCVGLALGSVYGLAQDVPAQSPAPSSASKAPAMPVAKPVLKVVAIVNGEEISRQELIQACLKDYGQETLERIVSRYILEEACKKANVEVTEADLRAEVETTAKRFNLTVEQYFQLLERERGISAVQYLSDIVWPQVAVNRLVGKGIQPTDEELQIEYERRYGESVTARMIASKTEDEAKKIREEALKDVSKFGELAQKYSVDPYTASLGGVVPPIRRHLNPEAFEKEIFALKAGEISNPVKVGDMFVLVLCEEQLPPDKEMPFDAVKGELEAILVQAKTADAGRKMAQKLVNEAKVEVVFNNPKLSAAQPGVAATVSGKVISLAVLGDACIDRFGKETLKGLINRKIVEQAAKKQKIEISDKDIDEEIARQALDALPPKDGKPDTEQFLKNVCTRLNTTAERYRQDAVLVMLMMQRLAEGHYEVTEEDLQRGYEANFGVKAKCRAIVLNDMRTAQRVWAEAREKGTEEAFSELAKKFSVDAASRANGGEVPPIAKFGGQPELEKEAFKLADGELSGVLQVGNVYIILLRTGSTEPIGVTFDEVKDTVRKEVELKKQQNAVGEIFQVLSDQATVENYLEGTLKSPQKKDTAQPDAAPKAEK